MRILKVIAIFTLCAMPFSAHAETKPAAVVDFVEKLAPVTAEKDKYIPMAFPDIARMYWAIGKMDLKNNAHIDNYLRINECGLFQRFSNDEIQWSEIQDATRKSLEKNSKSYPRAFDVVIPVQIGKYNAEGQYFEVTDKAVNHYVQRLELASIPFNNQCVKNSKVFQDYPFSVVLSLNRPFHLNKLPANKQLAAAFIEESRQGSENKELAEETQTYRRTAYLRLKFTFMMMKDTIKLPNHDMMAEIYTRLEGYEVYADKKRLRLIYTQDYDRRVAPRHKTETAPSSMPEAAPVPHYNR